MPYIPIKWMDHVVRRPRTFTEEVNPDKSITLIPAPGEVLQQGTPMNAHNLGSSEVAIMHYAAAFDMLTNIVDAMGMELDAMREQLSALAGDGKDVSD